MVEPNKNWVRPGRKGFNINYAAIAKIYIETDEGLDSLASRFGVSKWTLLDRFKKLHIQKTIRRHQDDNCFSEYTPESCYWAGFFAADGCVSKYSISLEISSVDKTHIEKFIKFLKSNAKIIERKKICFEKERNFCSINLHSKQIILDLKENFNIGMKKSLTYFPPTKMPKDLIKHFIRGYIDGDGCIGWHKHDQKPRISVCSGSNELLLWISDNIKLFNKDSRNPKVIKRKNSNLYTVEFIGNQTYEILDWLYGDCEYYLDRKYNRYLEYKLKNVIS